MMPTVTTVKPSTESQFAMHSLPAELIERILAFSYPREVSRFARTCRFAYQLVYEAKDQFLWRELYLGQPFDDLRHSITVPTGRQNAEKAGRTSQDIQWQSELQRRTQAELIAASGTRNAQLLQIAYETFLAAIDTASPLASGQTKSPRDSHSDSADTPTHSENLRWLDRVLRKTRVLDRVPAWTGAMIADTPSLAQTAPGTGTAKTLSEPDLKAMNAEDTDTAIDIADVCWAPERCHVGHQMRSRLRAYVALVHENSSEESKARMEKLRRTSRTYVYDMRKYQECTLWGPYRTGADGRTVLANWEHVEHILNVVGLKLREIPLGSLGFYKKPLFQMDALRAYSAIGSSERPVNDWAGVTGTWRRFVCFMDYRDLYMFNYSLLPPGPHDPTFFDDPFDEALRPVELRLWLISREEYFSEPRRMAIDPSAQSEDDGISPIGDYKDPAFPTLYFTGDSHGAVATVRGKVSTLSDGAIRWQFVTTYDGRLQWSAEAVQIGHVCSAAGAAGVWTGAHHDRDDPAGPFWMMKVSDRLPDGILNTLH